MQKILAINKKTLLIILALFCLLYYLYGHFFSNTKNEITYDLVKVERGNILNLVSGSGQIISETQIDAKAESSGKITSIKIKAGDKVYKGQTLATLDQRNAVTSLNQAQNSYTSAKANYDKFILGISGNDKKIASLSVEQAEENLKNAKQNLIDKLKIAMLDIKNDINQTNNLYQNFNTNYPSWTGDNIKNKNEYAVTQMVSQRGELNQKLASIENDTNNLDTENIENNLQNFRNILNQDYDYFDSLYNLMVNSVLPEAITQTKIDSYISLSSSAKTKAKNNLSSINSNLQSINNNKQSLEQSKLSYQTKIEVPKNEDIIIQKANLNNAFISLQNAQNNFDNTIVRAPFSGIVATVNAKAGEIGNTNIATLIADKKLAKIPVSEADAVKIKNGMQAKLTFDSIENIKYTGVVDSVDLIGTISSGVTTYNVFIKIVEDDIKIKPNMSVNVEIVLSEVKNVLKVEANAVKNIDDKNFIRTVKEEVKSVKLEDITLLQKPEKIEVEVGASNDDVVEIKNSEIKEGDLVIVKENNSSAATTQQKSILNLFMPAKSKSGTSKK